MVLIVENISLKERRKRRSSQASVEDEAMDTSEATKTGAVTSAR